MQSLMKSARKALAIFSETYWPPLYTFVRRRGYSPADAQDIVQGFFQHLLEQNTLSRADREKGRLRTFLLGSLQNYLLKQRERMRALKRGGGQQIVSFDDQLIDAEAAMQATSHLSDINSYDIAWASSIVTRAWKNVRESFAAEKKREWVDALKAIRRRWNIGAAKSAGSCRTTGDDGRKPARLAFALASTVSPRIASRSGEHGVGSEGYRR